MVLVLWCDVGGGGVEENLCPATSSSSGAGRRWNEEVCAPSDCTLAPADMHAVSSFRLYTGTSRHACRVKSSDYTRAPADMHAVSSISRLWRWESILKGVN